MSNRQQDYADRSARFPMSFCREMSNFDWTDDKHEKLSDKHHGSQQCKQSLDDAVERTPNRTTVKHQFEQWNQELLDHVFPLPLEPPYRITLSPKGEYYTMCISFRLEAAYNKPNGPLLSDNRVSSTDIDSWLTDNLSIQPEILQHLQKGRFDLALRCFDDHYYPRAPQNSPITSSPGDWEESLLTDWNGAYHGGALNALMEAIVHSEESLKLGAKNLGSTYYTKSMVITQSSGVGKSRLTSEFSKRVFTIAFTFREARSTGFPPGDPEVFKFLTRATNKIDIHTSVLSLLSCSLRYVNDWLARQTTTSGVSGGVLARQWHDKMAPVYVPGHDSLRSDGRIEFCGTVVQNARALQARLNKDPELRKTLERERYANLNNTKAIRNHLHKPVKILIDTLAAHTDKSKIPLLAAWVFDEIADLDSTDDSPNYYALQRILHSISEEPFWTIFLSTNSKVNRFAPPRAAESSARIKTSILKGFPPFYGFPMNVEWSRRMNDSENGLKEKELSKPMQEFATVDHMTMFGRPLWYAFSRHEPSEVQEFVQFKLLLGEWNPISGPTVVNQAFALIASRISLDPCMNQGAEAIELAQEAVNSHLRIITGYDENNGIISTATPSEPIVADGAAMVLMDPNGAENEYVWTSCIRTMVRGLLSKGLVQKGLKGELFARLVLVLASDFGRKKSLQHSVDFLYSQPFRVIDFFDVLFGSNYHNHIHRHDFNNRKVTEHVRARRGTGTGTHTVYHGFGEVFKTAYMNFNHFTYTTDKLPRGPGILRTVLHEMLQQHQALQLCENQEYWDLLIPMYFGSLCEPFDESKVSAILIQVKNRRKKTTLFTDPEAIKSRFPVEQPLIQILMDLGINLKTEFRFGFCTSPLVYSITARGADKHTFGCICPEGDESLAKACMSLLNELTPVQGRAQHDNIARGNCGLIFPSEENKDKNSKDSDEKQEGKEREQGLGIGGESTRVHDRVDGNYNGEHRNKKRKKMEPTVFI